MLYFEYDPIFVPPEDDDGVPFSVTLSRRYYVESYRAITKVWRHQIFNGLLETHFNAIPLLEIEPPCAYMRAPSDSSLYASRFTTVRYIPVRFRSQTIEQLN